MPSRRDAIGTVDPYLHDVRGILETTGFAPAQLSELVTTAQSQETVDRGYQGSARS